MSKDPDGDPGDDTADDTADDTGDDAGPPDAPAAAVCANGLVEGDERCDDGGLTGGDGCSATCTVDPYYRCTGEPSSCHRVTVLYAPTYQDDPNTRSAIATYTGGVVDYFDAAAATPTLEQLAPYDCVYTFVLNTYLDNVAFGDVLADHVDAGNAAVLGGFSTYTMGAPLAGRILQATYSPCGNPTGSNHYTTELYAGDGTSYLHTGVTTYGSNYRDTLVLQGDGIQDGTYADGEIATAYRPDFRVVYVNGVFGTINDSTSTGDYGRLLANACSAAFQ